MSYFGPFVRHCKLKETALTKLKRVDATDASEKKAARDSVTRPARYNYIRIQYFIHYFPAARRYRINTRANNAKFELNAATKP